jgi:hypothetical protein
MTPRKTAQHARDDDLVLAHVTLHPHLTAYETARALRWARPGYPAGSATGIHQDRARRALTRLTGRGLLEHTDTPADTPNGLRRTWAPPGKQQGPGQET